MKTIDINNNIFNISKDKFILDRDLGYIMLAIFGMYVTIFYILDKFSTIEAKTPKKRIQVIVRLLTTVHAISSCLTGVYQLLYDQSECGLYNLPRQNKILSCSMAFYLIEMSYLIYYEILDSSRLIHHVLVIFAQYECLVLNSGFSMMIRWGLYLDAVGIFFHLREALQNMGKKDTKIFLIFESLFSLFFLLPRIMIIKFTAEAWFNGCKNNLFVMNIANVLLLVQSFHSFLGIIALTKRRIKEYKERSSKGVELNWYTVNQACMNLSYNQHHKSHGADKKVK